MDRRWWRAEAAGAKEREGTPPAVDEPVPPSAPNTAVFMPEPLDYACVAEQKNTLAAVGRASKHNGSPATADVGLTDASC